MSDKKEERRKPVDVVIDETRGKVVQMLNDSGLSIGIIAMLLRDLSGNISNQAQAQLQALRQTEIKEGENNDQNEAN